MFQTLETQAHQLGIDFLLRDNDPVWCEEMAVWLDYYEREGIDSFDKFPSLPKGTYFRYRGLSKRKLTLISDEVKSWKKGSINSDN